MYIRVVGEAVFLIKEPVGTVAFLELKRRKVENSYKNDGFIFHMMAFFLNEDS